MAVPLAGGGYFFCIVLMMPKVTTAISVRSSSISDTVILSPPFFCEGRSAVTLLALGASVSLEHVNIMTWVSSIVNHRGFLTHQKKALNACFVGRARNIIRALGDSEH